MPAHPSGRASTPSGMRWTTMPVRTQVVLPFSSRPVCTRSSPSALSRCCFPTAPSISRWDCVPTATGAWGAGAAPAPGCASAGKSRGSTPRRARRCAAWLNCASRRPPCTTRTTAAWATRACSGRASTACWSVSRGAGSGTRRKTNTPSSMRPSGAVGRCCASPGVLRKRRARCWVRRATIGRGAF